MSRLWSHHSIEAVSSLGGFAVERPMPTFQPWATEADRAAGEEFEPGVDAEALLADAFARGFDEGRRSAELELAADRDALIKLAEKLEVLQPEPTNALALLLAETVDRLVRQIVGSVAVDGALLTARAEAAAALIGNEIAPARLRLNPEDLPLVDGARIPVALVADADVERGGLVLETGEGWIEDGPSVRLDRLRAELDRLGAPQ